MKEAEKQESTEQSEGSDSEGESGGYGGNPSAGGDEHLGGETGGGDRQSGGGAPNAPQQGEVTPDAGSRDASERKGVDKPNGSKTPPKLDLDAITSLRKQGTEEERAGKSSAAYRKFQEAWNLARGHAGVPEADALVKSLQADLARVRKELNSAGSPPPNKPITVR